MNLSLYNNRVKIANTSRADLFISIHINAATVDWMRGFEVYTVATDKNSTHTISNHHKNMIAQQKSNKDILQSLGIFKSESKFYRFCKSSIGANFRRFGKEISR